ncbi:Flagellar motor switch protein FliM [compost metagenome]
MPFQVVLGEAEVTVSDVVSLGVGDVLPLSTSVEADLSVLVSEQLKFKGKPGTLRNKMAIQITEVVDNVEGEEA